MNNKVRFQIQVRNFENCLLLSSKTVETDCSKNCNTIADTIDLLKKEMKEHFSDTETFYFQAHFLSMPTTEQLRYFNEHEC